MYFETNPFVTNFSSQGRLDHWKALREQLVNMSERDALDMVAEYWAMVPISNFSYNPENPEFWPTPWEMVYKGDWCDSMVAVGMGFTLRLAGWSEDRLEVISFRDYDLSEEKMVLRVDGSLTLNYTIGKVVDWPDTEKIITDIWVHKDRSYVSMLDK